MEPEQIILDTLRVGEYLPLDSPDHIRLLRLQPNVNRDAPLIASLRTASLDGNHSYTALSYSWDGRFDAEHLPKQTMQLNDVQREITGNLCDALRRFRSRYNNKTIWVDALCINQTDTTERSAQVNLMHKIYGNADQVMVWLGEDSEFRDAETFFALCALLNRARRTSEERSARENRVHSIENPLPETMNHHSALIRSGALRKEIENGFRALSEFPARYHSLNRTQDGPFPLHTIRTRIQRLATTPARRLYLEAAELDDEQPVNRLMPQIRTDLYDYLSRMVYIFSHRRYFTRRWILQEIHFAKRLVFSCGPWKFAWDDVRAACLTWAKPEYRYSHPGFDMQPLLRVFSIREDERHESGLKRLLLDMVGFHHFNCIDPRDRVYALLHLARSTSLAPDYMIPATSVYLRLAQASVDAGEACMLLDTAAAQWSASYDLRTDGQSRGQNDILPSWSPDWRLPVSISPVQPTNALPASIVPPLVLVVQAEYVGELITGEDVQLEGIICQPGMPDTPTKKTFYFNKHSSWASDLLLGQFTSGVNIDRDRLPDRLGALLPTEMNSSTINIQGSCPHARSGDIVCLSAAQTPGIEIQYAWILRMKNRKRNTHHMIGACWLIDFTRFDSGTWRLQPRKRELHIV